MSKHNQPPQYHGIVMLPTIATIIDGYVETSEEQLPRLEQARSKPWVLDNHTVGSVIASFTEQTEYFPILTEQLRRWRTGTLTSAQRSEIERLEGRMVRLREITESILKLADELKQGTIEKQLAKSDLELGMETLFNKWRTSK